MVQTAACKYKMLMNLRSKSPVHSDNDKESKKKNIQLNGYLAWLFYVWNLFNYNWNIKEVWQQFVFLVWKSSQDLWYANRNANAQMDYSKTRKKKDAAMIDRLTIVTDQQLPGWANKCNTSCRGAFTFFSEVLDLHEQHIRKKSK